MTKLETLAQVKQTANALLHANTAVDKLRTMTSDSLPSDSDQLRRIAAQLQAAETNAKGIVVSANIVLDIIEAEGQEGASMTHPSELATMAENVANCIVRATPPGIDAKTSGATVIITDTYKHRRYTLTVEAAEDTAEAWAVVALLDGLLHSVDIYTDRADAEAEREQIDGAMNAEAYMIAVELPQATPRRYEVAGFDRGSIETLIRLEAMAEVTDGDFEAIAHYMGDRYLSSDNFATDLRAAVSEVLPDAEHII